MFQRGLTPPDPFRERPLFERVRTQDGMSLATMLEMGRVLVVCLPPGPPRKWLARVAAARRGIEGEGARLLLVTIEDDPADALREHDLQYVARCPDPGRELYRHFGFPEGRKLGLFGAEQKGGTALLEGDQVLRTDASPPS
ncbi:MAG: hypothetical protein AAGD14_03400 [Planctomycetota bacterium]